MYPDDILLYTQSRKALKATATAVIRKLRQAGFLISPKSDLKPAREMTFVGKTINTAEKRMSNTPGVLAGAFRMYMRMVGSSLLRGDDMLRLLGRLQWPARPTSLSRFLAGAYQAADFAEGKMTRGLSRSIASALMFSLLPQRFPVPMQATKDLLFVDAAPAPTAKNPLRFHIGEVGQVGYYRSYICPRWVHTLQQAKLFALYTGIKIAAYQRLRMITLGTDSDVARSQLISRKAPMACSVQHRLLRRVFWARYWSGIRLGLFRVRSSLNTADPLSRVSDFPTAYEAHNKPELRRALWGDSPQPFVHLYIQPPPPWRPAS